VALAANLSSALPQRDSGSYGGDLLSMGFQVAVVVGGPLLIAAYLGQKLDEQFGTAPTLGLVAILVGLAVAGLGMFLIIRRYIARNPTPPTSDAALHVIEGGLSTNADVQIFPPERAWPLITFPQSNRGNVGGLKFLYIFE